MCTTWLRACPAVALLLSHATLASSAVRVTDLRGVAIEGAQVTTDSGERLATDADGRIPSETRALSAEAEGFLPWSGAPTTEVTLTRPSRIAVRVLGSVDRQALPKAQVSLTCADQLVAKRGVDASGRVAFDDLRAASCRLEVMAEGHAAAIENLALGAEASERVRVELVPTRALAGRVVHGGQPVKGARVIGVWAFDPEPEDDPLRPDFETLTDELGRFRFEGLPTHRKDSLVLVALGEEGAWTLVHLTRDAGTPTATSSIQLDELELDLAANSRLVLEVLGADEAAFVGATARLHPTAGMSTATGRHAGPLPLHERVPELASALEAETGDDGRAFWNVPELPWIVCIDSQDAKPTCEALDLDAEPNARVSLGERWSVSIVAVAPGGERLRDARVRAGERPVPRADDGQFLLHSRAKSERLVVEAPGRLTKRLRIRSSSDPVREVELPLASTLEVRVVGETAAPIPTVTWMVLHRDESGELRAHPDVHDRISTAALDGEHVVEGLPGGALALRAQAGGYLKALSEVVEVQAGERRRLSELVLERGLRLSGRVVDATDERPLAGVTVRTLSPARHAVSDTEGRWTLEALPPGERSVTASHPEYPSRPEHEQRVMLPADDVTEPVQLRLSSGGALEGRVTDSSGAPIVGLSLLASSAGARGRARGSSAQTNADGRFRFAALPEGRVDVSSRHRRAVRGSAEIRVGETARLDLGDEGIEVVIRTTLRGELIDARVMLMGLGGWAKKPSPGVNVFEGLLPGPLAVDVTATLPETGERVAETTHLQVAAGEPRQEFSIELDVPRVDLPVEIRDRRTGELLTRVGVKLRLEPGSHSRVLAAPEGRISVRLKDGDWSIEPVTYDSNRQLRSSLDTKELPTQLTVRDGEPSVDVPLVLEMDRRRQVPLELLQADGSPAAGARASFLDGPSAHGEGLSKRPFEFADALGRIRCEASLPGPHDLLVQAAGSRWAIFAAVPLDQDERLQLRLPPSGSLRIEGVEEVELIEETTGNGHSAKLPAIGWFPGLRVLDGALELTGVPSGSFLVRAGGRSERVEIVPGEQALVSF